MTRLSLLTRYFIRILTVSVLPLTWFSPYFSVRITGIVLTVVGSIAWLFWRRQRDVPLVLPDFAVPMALFVLWQLASVTFAPLPSYGLKFALMDAALLLLFFFFTDSLRLGWTINHWLTAVFTAGTAIITVEMLPAVVWLVRWKNLTGTLLPLPPVPFTLPGVLLTNPNVVSGFVNLFIPLILVNFFSASGIRRAGWSILLTFFVLAQYFSGSRTGWISLAAGTIITLGIIGLQTEHVRQLRRRQIITGLLVLTVIGYVAIQQVFWRGKQSFMAARGDIWRGAWHMFTAAPIFGNGVGSFAPLYSQSNGIPPGFAASHAHNLVLQLLAESGIIGIILTVIGLWLVGKTVFTFGRSILNQPLTAAWSGIATAALIHHLGDYLLWHPIYTATALLLLTIAIRQLPNTISWRHGNRWIATGVGSLVVLGLWTLRGNLQYERGLAAARADNWLSARENICAVAKQYPEKTLFGFQCGWASVRLADETGDAAPILETLPLTLDALKRDPFWSVHRANVAMMLWQAGNHTDGFARMEAVAKSVPQNVIFALNAGWMAEEMGDDASARVWYSHAIEISPPLANDVYFAMTPLRQSVPGIGDYRAPLTRAWNDLRAGLAPIAQMSFAMAIAKNPRDAEAWAGLAAAQLALKDPAAKRTLATAQFISPTHYRVVGTAATFAHFYGDDARVATILQNYVDNLASRPFHTNYYSRPYYFGAYNQVGLPFDLLPQFRRPMMDISMQPFIDLLKSFRQNGGNSS